MVNPLRSLFETRSTGAITDSHGLWEYLGRGWQSLAGVSVNESSALALPAVSTCVRLISRTISSLPVDVLERKDERTREAAVGHPARRLLTRPNGWQTFAEWLCQVIAHLLLRGNAYNWIVRDERGNVTELIPLHPDQVVVKQRPYPTFGIVYEWTDSRGVSYPPFEQREILHFRNLSTNGVTGRSILEDLRDTFGLGIATQNYAASNWSRGGLPSIILKHPKALSAGAAEKLETFWEKTYGGGLNQRRVAVAEEGMSIEQLSPKLADAQFVETCQFTEGQIFGFYHVPRFLSGNSTNASNWGTGIEQQLIGLKTFCFQPLIVGIEQRFSLDILGDAGTFQLKLFLQGLMRGDQAARGAFYRIMREVGAFSANDIRVLEDMNPIDKGDTYLQPLNLAPLGSVPAAPPATAKEPA